MLRSGVDREIARWRRKKMLERTMDKRPELFAKFVPQTDEDKALLDAIDAERHPRPVPPKIDCRRAEEADLPAILAIADEAKAFLAAQGLDQWQHGYPAEEDFRRTSSAAMAGSSPRTEIRPVISASAAGARRRTPPLRANGSRARGRISRSTASWFRTPAAEKASLPK